MDSDFKILALLVGGPVIISIVGICATELTAERSTAEPGCYTGARDGDKCVTVCVDKSRHAVATPVDCGVGR